MDPSMSLIGVTRNGRNSIFLEHARQSGALRLAVSQNTKDGGI